VADRPDDRVPDLAPEGDEPEPKVFFVVDGKSFLRPSLETYYARSEPRGPAGRSACSCDSVAGTYCSCNKVCTCNLVPVSSGRTCACDGHSRGGSYCSCNKICTCVPVY